MILDRIAHAENYLGINGELDKALHALVKLDFTQPMPARTEISKVSYYTCTENRLLPRRHRFEFHRRYIDIHVPVNAGEQIALCAADLAPENADFDEERDFGLFCGEETAVVTVPVGWFCVCFPWDAHEPVIGDENVILRKLVFKVFA